MGIILSALAAAGNAGVESMNQNIAQYQAMDRDKLQSDLALQKAEALEQFKVDSANTQRQAMVDRVGAAKAGIVGNAMATTYAPSDAAVADAQAGNTDAPLTPDQQAAIAQSKAIDTARLNDDPDTMVKAGLQTGDIGALEAAKLASTKDIAALKAENYARSIEAKLESAKDRTDMMGAIALIRAEAGGGKDGKLPSDAKMIDYLVQGGMDKKTATDRVMGTGAGATKDPVAMATSLASALIASGAVRVPKDAPPGTTVMSMAMDLATAQIQAAESKFHTPSPTLPVAPTPGGKPVASPATDPLGLFPGKK